MSQQPKRFPLNFVRSLKYTKTATGFECKVADDITATMTQNTTPTGEKIRGSYSGFVNGELVGRGSKNDCWVHIGFYLMDIPRKGELPPRKRDVTRSNKSHIDYVRDRIDEMEETMDDAPNDAGELNDKLFYANQLAELKAELKALEARAHISMSDYVKRCPVVGTYVLEAPRTVTKTFEQAAWYEEIDLAPGVYEVRADLDYEGNRQRPRIKTLFIPMAGYVRKAHFPAVCGGMQYSNKANDEKEVGRPASFTLSMGTVGFALKELGDALSLWIKWDEDPHFYYLTDRPEIEAAPTHPSYPGEKLELIELINPYLSGGSCSYVQDGETVTKRYITYEFPDNITSAIGIGCSGRTLGVPEGTPTPAVWCLKRQHDGETYYIAVYYAGYRR